MFDRKITSDLSANQRILVADDDPLVLELFRRTFLPESKLGAEFSYLFDDQQVSGEFSFDLTTVSQGEDAVIKVRESLEQREPYAVIFLDERMPPGIGGREAARQIRELDSNIHIVISTAYTDFSPSDYRLVIFSHLYFMRKPLNVAEVEHMAYNACMSWNRNQQLQAELNSNVAYRIWLNRLFDALPVPVVVVDVENYQVEMSGGPIHSAHDATACYQQLYARGIPCSDAEGGCPLQEVLTTKRPVILEHRHTTRGGDERRYELHCIPIHNELGEVRQMLEFSIDITEREQRIQEKEVLVRQQKQLFDTFRSTAHTMKNTVGYLNGMTERMMAVKDRSGPLGELLTEERVGLIQEQVSMIHTMLQIALGRARSNAGEQTTLSVQQKVQETLSLFAISKLGKGKLVDLKLPENQPLCIRMTAIDCQTMLLNLLNNAAEAVDEYLNSKLSSGDAEDLDLLMEIQDQPMIVLQVTELSAEVVIEIVNRGDLIPELLLEKVFEQGHSGKETGNGIGLYDVRQIVRQSGGSIEALNGTDGVKFRVVLPAVACDFESVV